MISESMLFSLRELLFQIVTIVSQRLFKLFESQSITLKKVGNLTTLDHDQFLRQLQFTFQANHRVCSIKCPLTSFVELC